MVIGRPRERVAVDCRIRLPVGVASVAEALDREATVLGSFGNCLGNYPDQNFGIDRLDRRKQDCCSI